MVNMANNIPAKYQHVNCHCEHVCMLHSAFSTTVQSRYLTSVADYQKQALFSPFYRKEKING